MSTLKEIEAEFLTCDLCWNIYNEPKLLPCSHTFCEACLKSYIASHLEFFKYTKGVSCPVCRKKISRRSEGNASPGSWTDSFPDNFYVQQLIEKVQSRKEETTSTDEEETSSQESPSPAPEPGEVEVSILTSEVKCQVHPEQFHKSFCCKHQVGLCTICERSWEHLSCRVLNRLTTNAKDLALSKSTSVADSFESLAKEEERLRDPVKTFSQKNKRHEEEVASFVESYFSHLIQVVFNSLDSKQSQIVFWLEQKVEARDGVRELNQECLSHLEAISAVEHEYISLADEFAKHDVISAIHESQAQKTKLDHFRRWCDDLKVRTEGRTYDKVDKVNIEQLLQNLPLGEFYSLQIPQIQFSSVRGGARPKAPTFKLATEWIEEVSNQPAGISEYRSKLEYLTPEKLSNPFSQTCKAIPTRTPNNQLTVPSHRFRSNSAERIVTSGSESGHFNRRSTSQRSFDRPLTPSAPSQIPTQNDVSSVTHPSTTTPLSSSMVSNAGIKVSYNMPPHWTIEKRELTEPFELHTNDLDDADLQVCSMKMNRTNKPISIETVGGGLLLFLNDDGRQLQLIDTVNSKIVCTLHLSCMDKEVGWKTVKCKLVDIAFIGGRAFVGTDPGCLMLRFFEFKPKKFSNKFSIRETKYIMSRPYMAIAYLGDDKFVASFSQPCFGSKVMKIDKKGKTLETLYSDVICPRYLHVTESSLIVISDTRKHSVICITQSGELRFRFNAEPTVTLEPSSVCSNSKGCLFFVNWTHSKLHVVNLEDGRYKYTLDFPDSMSRLHAICLCAATNKGTVQDETPILVTLKNHMFLHSLFSSYL